MYYNAAAEKILTKILTEQINREIRSFMKDLRKDVEINGGCGPKSNKIRLKPTKSKKKPKQKEYFGDIRYENDGVCDYGDPVGPLGKKGKSGVIFGPYVPYGPTNAPIKVKSKYFKMKIKEYGDCGEANCTYDDRG